MGHSPCTLPIYLKQDVPTPTQREMSDKKARKYSLTSSKQVYMGDLAAINYGLYDVSRWKNTVSFICRIEAALKLIRMICLCVGIK